MRIKSAAFVKSCADAESMSDGSFSPQICVAGRSNCGKSSLLNTIMGVRLCKTSSTPGRTRLLNVFSVKAVDGDAPKDFFFVDLPGYGFHAASKSEGEEWGERTSAYLEKCKDIAQVLCLMDIRRDPSALDKTLINYLRDIGLPFTAVLTKSDKLSRSAVGVAKTKISAALGLAPGNVIVTSSVGGAGKQELLDRISAVIDFFYDDGVAE